MHLVIICLFVPAYPRVFVCTGRPPASTLTDTLQMACVCVAGAQWLRLRGVQNSPVLRGFLTHAVLAG
jgi:hypothetical protein